MRRTPLFLLLSLLFPALAAAQGVPIKTIPVAEGSQFLFFPSERLAMGGVGIALDDRYADPFVNPAKTVNVRGARFVSAPVYYGFGPLNGRSGEGSGRTLPIGGLAHHDNVFGGALVVYQEMATARRDCCFPARFIGPDVVNEQSGISLNNLYVFGLGGAELPAGWSLGVSAFHGSLQGLEGVQRLYTTNTLRQRGAIRQYRVGLYRDDGDGHAGDVVLMHHRLDMTHTMREGGDAREEYDRTQSVALQAGYRYAFYTGWTLGARVAGDWKWHPKIPNYDLMNIPRDPGNSAAYNLGIGLATTSGAATFGIDVIYEPIWSHTWAEAAEPVEAADGSTIAAGEKTVDNQFDFRNGRIRMGVHRDGEKLGFSFGLDMHHISYDLDQMDFEDDERRLLDNNWTEWTFSTGLGADLGSFRIQYAGHLTLGTGTPSVQRPWGWGARQEGFGGVTGADWVVAPDGPLALEEIAVLTHQVALIVPLTR